VAAKIDLLSFLSSRLRADKSSYGETSPFTRAIDYYTMVFWFMSLLHVLAPTAQVCMDRGLLRVSQVPMLWRLNHCSSHQVASGGTSSEWSRPRYLDPTYCTQPPKQHFLSGIRDVSFEGDIWRTHL
jgi:hypothetical protein